MRVRGAAGIAALSLALWLGSPAYAQRGHGLRPANPGIVFRPAALSSPAPQRPGVVRGIVQRPAPVRDARQMLIRMVRAENGRAFIAREAQLSADGGTVEYLVKRDPHKGLRRESTRPLGELIIDNYKKSWRSSQRGQRFVESNSTLVRGKPEEIIRRAMGDQLQIEWIGQERVAGRVTDIISVVPIGVAAPSRRFWIDRQTGLRLKTEEYDPNGRLRASAYVINLDLKPVFNDDDFTQPDAPAGATVTKQVNRKFPTVEAAARAGYPSRQPQYLPPGFRLTRVVVVNDGDRIVQNYSNGLNLISLIQTSKSWGKRVLGMLDANQRGFVPVGRDQHAYTWRVGNLVYIVMCNLPDGEKIKIADSVQ